MKKKKEITRTIRILLVLIAVLSSGFIQAQDFKARTEPVTYDFTKPEITIIWITPAKDQQEVDSKQLQIEIGIISKSGISSINIYVNQLPVSTNRGFKKKDTKNSNYDLQFDHLLHLNKGMNTVKVSVTDDYGNVEESERTIRVLDDAWAVVRNRTNYALIFGADQYDEWGDLSNPVNDAREIARELKEAYSFEVDLVENPTKQEVMEKIRDYAEKSYLPYDQLFIFFAGHGQFDEINGEGYIVSRDSRMNDRIFDTYLSHTTLRTRIDNIPARHIFLTIDACFGGTFDPTIARAGTRGGGDAQYEDISRVELIERKLQYKTRMYLTSGGKVYVSDGRPGANSPFAAKFLEALRSDGGSDNLLTLSDIKSYVELVPQEPRMGSFGSDEPGSEFVFERKK